MKAVTFSNYGDPADVLSIKEIPDLPAPPPGHVTVRVVKRRVHAIDGTIIRGHMPPDFPLGKPVPGSEGVGVIECLGEGLESSSSLAIGTRVMFFPAQGSWAEMVHVPAIFAVPIPDDIDDAVACQLYSNGVTAITLLNAVNRADPRAGFDTPLYLTAAGSGVARMLITLAHMRGQKAIAMVRSDTEARLLAEEVPGLAVISSQSEGWQDRARDACGASGISVALDPVGGQMINDLLELILPEGTLLTYGVLDPQPAPLSPDIIFREQAVRGVSALSWVRKATPEQRARDLAEIFEMARVGSVHFSNFREFSLTEAADAIAASDMPSRTGSIILTS